jgi:hypothetical protein
MENYTAGGRRLLTPQLLREIHAAQEVSEARGGAQVLRRKLQNKNFSPNCMMRAGQAALTWPLRRLFSASLQGAPGGVRLLHPALMAKFPNVPHCG